MRTLKSLIASLQPATTSAGPRLALLVNNAAYQVVAPFEETTLAEFNEVMSTNLAAPFMLTKLLLPELKVCPGRVTVARCAFADRTPRRLRRRRAVPWS